MMPRWEAQDVRAGVKVGRTHITERWMIGYHAGTTSAEPRFSLVSMVDGMITEPRQTTADFADTLTRGFYWPEELLTGIELWTL